MKGKKVLICTIICLVLLIIVLFFYPFAISYKVVYEKEWVGKLTIDLSEFSRGLYNVLIKGGSELFVEKLILQVQ